MLRYWAARNHIAQLVRVSCGRWKYLTHGSQLAEWDGATYLRCTISSQFSDVGLNLLVQSAVCEPQI
jgi:hypothetical protein